jgi:hypothetical protein
MAAVNFHAKRVKFTHEPLIRRVNGALPCPDNPGPERAFFI